MGMVITSLEIKNFIIETLGLEDLTPDGIGDEEPLFADGLGLDSIDALELGVALRKTYTITIETVSEEVKAHFTSVNTLAAFIRSQQGTGR